jgi:hypothetical protein
MYDMQRLMVEGWETNTSIENTELEHCRKDL